MAQVQIDPVVEGTNGAIMEHIEKRLNRFENKNTFWRHMTNGTMDQFDAGFETAMEKLRGQLGARIPLVVGGETRTDRPTFDMVSPADHGLTVGTYTEGTRKDVQDAIRISKQNQPDWEDLGWNARASILEKAADLMTENFYELCAVMSFETGKTRFESSIDVDEGIDFLRFYAMEMREMNGFDMLMGKPFPNETCRSIRRPVGVFGVVCPFNFPIAITAGMTAGALLTGNAAIMKPSRKGVLSGWWVYRMFVEAGVPETVLHFITGPDQEVGDEIIRNPDIDGLVFTGSKKIGHLAQVKQIESGHPKPFIAEMGGKNAVLITKNADLDKAAEGVYKSAFGFSGQKCSACSRVYVERSVRDAFVAKLLALAKDTIIDLPWKKETFMGPVIEEGKVELYKEVVAQVKKDGGTVLHGGQVREDLPGNYVEPTIVTGLHKDHRVFREEFFMPFTAILEVDSLEEAIHEYNQVQYGLTAGIMSEDEEELAYFFRHIQSGVTYANRRAGGCTAAVVNGQSFVGWKWSGSSGNGAGGRYYLLQFTRERSQTIA